MSSKLLKNKKILIPVIAFIFMSLVLTLKLLQEKRISQEYMSIDFPTGSDFSLPSTKGTFHLKDHRGKIILLYFGYTFCPDICPTTLSSVGQVLKKLNEDELKQVTTLFIGVDVKRDTLEKLTEYTEFFHPSIIGATGKADELKKIANSFGVNYVIQKPEEGKEYYLVDHSTQLFILDREGKIADMIPHGEKVEDIYNNLKSYFKESK